MANSGQKVPKMFQTKAERGLKMTKGAKKQSETVKNSQQEQEASRSSRNQRKVKNGKKGLKVPKCYKKWPKNDEKHPPLPKSRRTKHLDV